MISESKITAKNSVVLITDMTIGEVPESMDGKLVAATGSCIAVGTLSETDGETSIILTDDKQYVQRNADLQKVFAGNLATPTKQVNVRTVLLENLLTLRVPRGESSIEIWANSVTEPDKLLILVT